MPADFQLKVLILSLYTGIFTLNACAGTISTPAAARTINRQAVHRNLLTNANALHAAEQTLKLLPQFNGQTINVFGNIQFFSGIRPRIELDIQDPNDPEKIVRYVYEHGQWQHGNILDIPPEGLTVSQHLTPLTHIKFADVARFAHIWTKKARSVKAVITEPYFIAYVLLPKQQKRFWHTATIEAVGEQYYLSFHADGTIWEFKNITREK